MKVRVGKSAELSISHLVSREIFTYLSKREVFLQKQGRRSPEEDSTAP